MRLFGIRWPILQAPMAGGPDTPELAAAVSNAGGLGSIGGAYLSAAQIEAAAARVRQGTDRPFALNLFVRADEATADPAVVARSESILRGFRGELGLPEPPKAPPAEPFDMQLEAVLRARPAVFSFTFGVPTREQLAALQKQSIVTVGTATTLDEALALEDAGVDAICAQGA